MTASSSTAANTEARLEVDGRVIRLHPVGATGRAIARSVEGRRERAAVLLALAADLDPTAASQVIEALGNVDVARLSEAIDPSGGRILRDAGKGPLRAITS